jgi:GC-rich sequence DNA-binding factor
MFTKRGKKPSTLLSRSSHQDDEDADNDSPKPSEDEDSSPTALAAAKMKAKKKKEKTKLTSRLSFGSTAEDSTDGEETFKVKKSNLSLNMAARTLHMPIASPERPTYDSEYLGMLKASTPSRPGSYQMPQADLDVSMDVSYDANESVQADDIEIPAASSIQHAKERRERLRASKPADDYISLSLTTRSDRDDGPHPESRLVREEDELGEGDDEYAEYTAAQERIALGKRGMKKEKMQRREEMRDLIEDLDLNDEDPEEEGWESEVLRRAGSSSIMGSGSPKLPPKPLYKPAPIPETIEIPSVSIALGHLTSALNELQISHTAHKSQLNQITKEQEELERRETELRELVIEAEEKRTWWKDFENWIGGVGAFLDEKVSYFHLLPP